MGMMSSEQMSEWTHSAPPSSGPQQGQGEAASTVKMIRILGKIHKVQDGTAQRPLGICPGRGDDELRKSRGETEPQHLDFRIKTMSDGGSG